nr:hypothetical protein [Tanacetum cinerariifolium]
SGILTADMFYCRSNAITLYDDGRRDEGVYVTPITIGLTGVTTVMIIEMMIIKHIDDNMDIV